ncbi:IS21 family transposase [Cryobacterium tagatosivorans]|uniref:IS21 family transposase n=1 Tax=Cryobacterium tagatosivorans TaxID=1259199 RepID=A0A4R8UIG0_9MICO|nr:IS21 family transposase [Cryobacterium tagatosivorans]TFB54187.1 IS21 family transposase [Cryobacterium tagatosivorans]
MQDWAEIRHLHVSEGMSVRAIAKQLGLSRVTVTRAVQAAGPPQYRRDPSPSVFDEFEDDVRRLLKATPSMPASVVAERVGWTGSSSWFRKKVAQLKPEFAPKDPADRINYRAGDQAQCDLWFPPVDFPLGDGRVGSPPVLVIVASFSRLISGVMLPSRTTPDLLAGMWSLLSGQLEAVPHRLIWDNEAGIGWRNKLAEGVPAFCGALATKIVQLKPFDPESKGIVERANQFLETSFLPGRTFTSVADFNEQLAQWLPTANNRTVRSLRARPIDRVAQDRAGMLAVPPPPPVGFTTRIRLPRDYYVRVFGNDYSVDPSAIGRMVDIHANLTQVTVRINDQVVAVHERAMGSAVTITDPEHVSAAKSLRVRFQTPTPEETAESLERDLADYDAAFGVSFEQGEEVA